MPSGVLWDIIFRALGYLGEYFSGLGGSWEQVGFFMDFGTLPRTTKMEVARSSGG